MTLFSSAVAAPPEVPPTPAAVDELVYARAFRLDQPYKYRWRAEAPSVDSGHLIVIRVDPALVQPRQQAEPVLYVGNQTAMRLNAGVVSGYVVALVPGDVAIGQVPIWFGTPELPERVDAQRIAAERKLADSSSIEPVELQQAVGPEIRAADMTELLLTVDELVRRFAPDEIAQPH